MLMIFIGKYSPEAMELYVGPKCSYQLHKITKIFISYQLILHKTSFFIKITKSGIERLGPSVINLANMKI